MALPSLGLLVGALIFAASFWPSTGLISTAELNPPLPKSISDLKEAIIKRLGFHADDIKVSGFDTRDALVGQSVAYEFDVEIDNTVIPLKLLEDVNRWDYVDLPIFRTGDSLRPGNENGLVSKQKTRNRLPVLAPFQLAGPMELWIQDAKDMRIALPHDVDAGVLKKVILADGATVTVKGARSVSLRHPLELPLPLNRSNDGFASGMLALAESLRHAARTQGSPLLSLRIVGPTSLTSPSYSNNKLKLKRLAPGLVELSPPSPASAIEDLPAVDLEEAPTLLTPRRFTTVWPLASINGSNSNLLGFEALLASVLGPRAKKEGGFKVSKAEVSAQTFLKMGFRVEKRVGEIEGFPGWRTKPEMVRMEFEALARVEGERVVAEKIVQVNPVVVEDTVAPNMLVGNTTMSTSPIVNLPSDPFTL